MTQKSESAYCAYDEFAPWYDDLANDADTSFCLMQHLLAFFGYEKTFGPLLDIGCGTGQAAIKLAQSGCDVTGVDFSESMLKIARDKAAAQGLSAQFVQQDMRKLHLDQTFGCIYSIETFVHLASVEDLRSTVRACFAHLKPKGILIFDSCTPSGLAHLYAEKRCGGNLCTCTPMIEQKPEQSARLILKLDFAGGAKKSIELHCKGFSVSDLIGEMHGAGYRNIQIFSAKLTLDGSASRLAMSPVLASTPNVFCVARKP